METSEVIDGNGRPSAGLSKPAAIHASAIELLEQGKIKEAIELLKGETEPSDLTSGLLGTALLLLEEYAEAQVHLKRAIELDPNHHEWREKLRKAWSAAKTRADLQQPPYEPPDLEVWLGPPAPAEGVLPLPDVSLGKPGGLDRVRGALGHALGRGVTAVLHRVTPLAGRLLGTADEVWTNWYRRPQALGILTLAYMREQLNHNNLFNPYPPDTLVAFQSPGLVAPPAAKHFRTADGSWNNLTNPKEGAAFVRFPRNVNPAVTWPKRAQLLSPNPAELSQVLFARGPEGMKPVPFLNLLAAAWIQFNVHDWVSHRSGLEMGLHEIPLPEGHPARTKYHQTKMFVGRTEADPTRRKTETSPPTYINEVTSWWDASQIYGSDQATADRLRSFSEGKLKLDPDGRLPSGAWGFEDTGFTRNWWVGLALLHTLFVREHNAICDYLAYRYRDWEDNRMYHVARLINAAVIAKIHTVEWTPAILPNPGLYQAMNANWYGLLETNRRRRADRRVFPWIKITNPEIGGIVGNAIDKHGVPYGLSDEFTEIYRLHELLPDELEIRRIGSEGQAERIALAESRQAGARSLSDRVAMGDLFYSFGNMHPGQLVLNNYPDTLRELTLPGNPILDLAAVDILRARERGVPRYNEFRRQLGLKPIRCFEDLTSDASVLHQLKRLYDNDIEAIDLIVGTRAETQRPTGYGFGETMFQLFILNASRRLQADRFYTDDYTPEIYTPEGLAWIEAADFKSVLLRHFPELGSTGLRNVTNAFEPWDAGDLDLVRHPLRAFDH